jgi:V/A-type H+/Na+-transporting ATPase subunit E
MTSEHRIESSAVSFAPAAQPIPLVPKKGATTGAADITPAPLQTPQAPAAESAGVEILIARLRDEGVAEGRSQAQALVAAAKQQATDIVAAAKREAEGVAVKAKEEAGKLKAAGEDAIRLAMRDTMLSLEGDLINLFRNKLEGLVKGMLEDPAFLQRLILEVAGKAAPSTERAELLLPAEIVSLEDLQRKPEEAKPGTLAHFVLSLGGGMLREGVSFGVADGLQAGIRIKLADQNMQIDLTESAVSQLLLRHMLPRFRALLRGKTVVDHVDTKRPETVAPNGAVA